MTVFIVSDTEFGWEEIVAAAEVWGEWQPFVEQTRQSLACLQLASETGQLPARAETREAATAFRYARNLISADETQAWLRAWGMTVDQWMNYLRGQLLRERWANRLAEITAANPVSNEEAAKAVKNHAVCSGKFIEWARKLAGRAAVAAKSGALASSCESPRELIENIDAGFDAQRRLTVTPGQLEARIADHQLDWIRFDCRYVWFPEERIAREAALCVTEDGLTLDEVAHDARSVVQRWDFYLDEIEANVRPHFLAARQGDWLGPVKIMEGFPLFSIINKQMPAANDPRIRRRAEQAVIISLIEKEMNERVRWMIGYQH
ncbi:MAG TPA: hypothetical protein VFY40_01120 [Blastocatellia bacterium]|nr:hypothetical protein [Blastocatellia bacterium]